MKKVIGLFGCMLLVCGCAALGAVGGKVDAAKGSADDAKGKADDAKGQAKDTGDQAKAAKAAPGSGDKGAADDTRLQATESGLNAPLDDSVDNKTDAVDWRKFNIAGKPGVATFELHWDDEKANLDMDVYNSFGDLIGKSPRKLQGTQAKRILIQVDQASLYYVRVTAPNKGEKSIYTLKVLWDGDKKPKPDDNAAAAANQPTTPPAGGTANAAQPATPPGPPQPPPPPIPFAQDPNKVLARIVSAYRDGGGWMLQIDKGSAQKVKSGQTGSLLTGDDGDALFDGGGLTIAQVVSDSKALARCPMSKPLGKNKRIVINLK